MSLEVVIVITAVHIGLRDLPGAPTDHWAESQQVSDVSVSSGISFRCGGGELLCGDEGRAPRHRTPLGGVSLPSGIMVFPKALKDNSTSLT